MRSRWAAGAVAVEPVEAHRRLGDHLEQRGVVRRRGEPVLDAPGGGPEVPEEDVVLGGEVAEEGPAGDPRRGRDVLDGRVVEPPLSEELERHLLDRGTRAGERPVRRCAASCHGSPSYHHRRPVRRQPPNESRPRDRVPTPRRRPGSQFATMSSAVAGAPLFAQPLFSVTPNRPYQPPQEHRICPVTGQVGWVRTVTIGLTRSGFRYSAAASFCTRSALGVGVEGRGLDHGQCASGCPGRPVRAGSP